MISYSTFYIPKFDATDGTTALLVIYVRARLCVPGVIPGYVQLVLLKKETIFALL